MPALKRIGAAALSAFGFGQGGAGITATYLIVAGGGGAGGGNGVTAAGGGGGGAGGYQTSTTSLSLTTSYTVVVGAGGVGGTTGLTAGRQGSNSTFGTLTASIGGGFGGAYGGSSGTAGSGGSGGGSGSGLTGGAGAGTAGQGNNGGASAGPTYGPNYGAAGGGGAGAVGATGTSTAGGNGGNGNASSITGTSVTYAGGGGGGTYNGGTTGTGGTGGGGTAATSTGGNGNNGTVNLGGGGGGASGSTSDVNYLGGNGGSGIVIVSYTGAQQFGGGVVTSAAGNTIHTFYTSGVLSPLSSLSASYLIVAGGGGAAGGGGGAGGLLSGSGLTIDTNSTYVVTVGAGGSSGTGDGVTNGSNGSASTLSIYATTAVGGGGGGTAGATGAGKNGGSGGGGGGRDSGTNNGGSASPSGQGNDGGGNGGRIALPYPSGGGGGAGQTGQTAPSASVSGFGGNGTSSSISGTATFYAGGGGGACYTNGYTPGVGGLGGGGAGASTGAGTAGTVNTGGGGGGGSVASTTAGAGGNGGSGIVVIAYAGSTQQMSGGTVTVSGGNVIHTFTSSGYLSPLTNFGNSLRFRSSNSAYLSRTLKTPTNNKIFTVSFWFKIGSLTPFASTAACFLNSASSPAIGGFIQGYQNAPYDLGIGEYNTSSWTWTISTSAVFRDPAAWYHAVFAIDTTQATASNRAKIYVNGIQQALATASYPSQNASIYFNSALPNYIGSTSSPNQFFDGEITNYNFIDGQALTPNSFGSFNQYGNWVPVTYGGSYGNNGFFLPFNSNQTSSYAGSFNGSSQALTAGSAANWKFMNDGSVWTAEAWVYPTSLATTDTGVFCTNASSGGYGMFVGLSDLATGDMFVSLSNNTGGGNYAIIVRAGPGTLVVNRWQHIAITLTATALVIYVNGKEVGYGSTASTSFGNANPNNTMQIGRFIGSAGALGGYFQGYISNVRITNTVVYSSNFTPSTSPLTAITGTQLLTCQNSTFIDNSTNAYTITNVGTTTSAVQYPFSISVFDDQSPNGNNWAATNFSGLAGATYDYLVDVPTLSNATSSNYAVVNPLNAQANVSATNGNLSISLGTVTGNIKKINATMGLPSTGKFYWESLNTGSTNVNMFCGIQTYTASLTSIGTNDIFYNEAGEIQNNGTSSGTIYGTLTTGDTLGIAYDADANKLYFYKNGTLQNTGGTTPAFTGPYIPFFGMYATNNGQNITFGQQPFKYTVPSGFVALNAFNM